MSLNVLKLVATVAVLGLAGNRGASAQAPSCTDFEHSVTAQISTVGEAAAVSPDRACLAPGGKMNWTAADGETFSIDFADDDHSAFPKGHRHYAGKVKKTVGAKVRTCSTTDPRYDATAGGCVFKYKAGHVKDGKASTIDPEVVVKPGA